MSNLTERWNAEHLRVPEDKLSSAYAEDKERLFPRGSSVVDVGGGQGHDAEYFAQKGHRVTLADLSPVALERAAERIKRSEVANKVSFVQFDAGTDELPVPDGSRDVIYSRLALHYFDMAKTVNVFEKLARKLKPSGKAYITVKSPDDAYEMEYLRQNAKEIEPGVFDETGKIKSRFSKDQWEQIMQKAGISTFQIRSIEEDLSGRSVAKSGTQKLSLWEIEFGPSQTK